jgi:hypothetical protein
MPVGDLDSERFFVTDFLRFIGLSRQENKLAAAWKIVSLLFIGPLPHGF